MPTLAARLALSAAGAVVVLTGVEALRWRHPLAKTMPPVSEEPVPEPPPSPPRFAPRPAQAPAARPVPQPASPRLFALARIHGQVVGDAAAIANAEIAIEDAERTYQPKIEDDGAFDVHLPPGSYAISASSGSLVALAEVRGLAPNEEREVLLRLVEGVAIQGRVSGCDGPCAGVSIHTLTSVRVQSESIASDAEGEFVINGLVPGQAYDLVFQVTGRRQLTLRDIAAPARDVVATLEPSGTLVGGFGVEPGEACPMQTVSLKSPQDDDERAAEFDPDCRFRIEELPAVASVHLRASGKGWHFSIDVALPEHGDPPFLCLHPPCREPEPEAQASLAVIVAGESGSRVYVQADFPDGNDGRAAACYQVNAPCVLDNLRAHPEVTVVVAAAGCEARTYTLNLMPGPNFLTSPCEAVRLIVGVIRGVSGKTAVRCSSRHPALPTYGGRFVLRCPTHSATIEYQLAENDPWRTAAVSGSESRDLVRLEIGTE